MENQNDSHLKSIGYILWLFGFTGSHRFYYGKPITGTIWFFTKADRSVTSVALESGIYQVRPC
jgi:hypothetical protein